MGDTIFATSSGNPPAAIAIIRISGPAAFVIAEAIAGALPRPRFAALKALRNPHTNELLDRALVLAFPSPRTATGEDLVEFHVHGGRAVVAAVEAAIASLPGTRKAEAGEFTRRALENGVIDLTAAEGLGDLLSAQTETQRRAALRMAEGGLRALVDDWTTRLIDIAARVEAQLDFSDEDDVADIALGSVVDDIAVIAAEVGKLVDAPPVERLNDGIRVVIAGPPNSGKSTLLNALVCRDVAIVSPISGTTRDRIEASVARDGIAYVLTDTAGLTTTPGDEIERIGITRATMAISTADIVVWLGDAVPEVTKAIVVHARADLPDRMTPSAHAHLAISAATGVGLEQLWTLVGNRAVDLLPQEDAVATNDRQRAHLRDCHSSLTIREEGDLLIVAEGLRTALRSLDSICGRGRLEDVLDSIFSQFCIGK